MVDKTCVRVRRGIVSIKAGRRHWRQTSRHQNRTHWQSSALVRQGNAVTHPQHGRKCMWARSGPALATGRSSAGPSGGGCDGCGVRCSTVQHCKDDKQHATHEGPAVRGSCGAHGSMAGASTLIRRTCAIHTKEKPCATPPRPSAVLQASIMSCCGWQSTSSPC